MKVSPRIKSEIYSAIASANMKLLKRKLKKLGGFGEQLSVIKKHENYARFLVRNKLVYPKGLYRKSVDELVLACNNVLIRIK